MKKVLSLMLAILLIVALVGCGSKDVVENKDTPATSPTAEDIEVVTPAPTEKDDASVFTGEVTEAVVRNYKVANERDFEWTEIAGGVRITEYLGSDAIVVIPKSIDGKAVVEIGGYTFANDSPVRGVYLPESVTALGATFPNNDDVEVVICEGAEEITDGAFLNCPKLHTVVLGDALVEIGENAFSACESLKELYIAPSVTAIDESYALVIFFGCDSLTITGEAGSYIETFCAEQGIAFEAK